MIAAVSFREYLRGDSVLKSDVQYSVHDYLRGRTDCVLIGAFAVNEYLPENEQRMTGDIDLVVKDQVDFGMELRRYLTRKLNAYFELKQSEPGVLSIYLGETRHVDLIEQFNLPPCVVIGGVCVLDLPDLIAAKKQAAENRKGTIKGAQDAVDLMRLLELATKSV